jgi:hypothetical protein
VALNIENQKIGFSNEMMHRHCGNILQALKSCHLHSPDRNGVSESELRKQTNSQFPAYLLKAFLNRLLKESAIKNNSGGYSLASHKTAFNKEENALWQAVNQAMVTAGVRGMTTNEIAMAVNLPSKQLNLFISKLCRDGLLVKLATSLYISPSCLAQLRKVVEKLVEKNDDHAFTVADFRNAASIGRNRCIEILECFDAKCISKRIGEAREVLATAADAFDKLLKNSN